MSDDKEATGGQTPAGGGQAPAENAAAKPNVYDQAREGKLFSKELDPHHAKVADLQNRLKAADITPENKTNLEKELADAVKARSETGSKAWSDSKMNLLDKAKASFGGVFNKNGSKPMQWVRGGAAVGAVVYAGKKGYDLFSPERDEKGERKESVWVTIGKAGAALAAAAALTLAGGKNKAMGI